MALLLIKIEILAIGDESSILLLVWGKGNN